MGTRLPERSHSQANSISAGPTPLPKSSRNYTANNLNTSFLFGTYSSGKQQDQEQEKQPQQQQQQSQGLQVLTEKGSTVATTTSSTCTTEKMEPSAKITKNHVKERSSRDREKESVGSGAGGGSSSGKFSVLQKWLRGDGDKSQGERRSSPGR